MIGGASVPLCDDDDYGRDGMFADDDLFLVYERDDVCALMRALQPASVTLQLVEVAQR